MTSIQTLFLRSTQWRLPASRFACSRERRKNCARICCTFLVRHNGQPAMMLDVVMKEHFNGLDLGKALQAEQKRLQTNLPAGISFAKVMDESVLIKEAVGEFQFKFFVALLVVMIVCLVS